MRLYLVHGRDSAAFDETPHPLHEEHQRYMDGWLPRLIARGPTLSEDGERHTGSVHVVQAADRQEAERFAFDEPFARAGWYATVDVVRFESLLPGTMWDRPNGAGRGPSAFAVVSCPANPPTPPTPELAAAVRAAVAGEQWPFAGLLLSDDASHLRGFAGGVDLSPGLVATRLPGWLAVGGLAPAGSEVARWQRGGRQQE